MRLGKSNMKKMARLTVEKRLSLIGMRISEDAYNGATYSKEGLVSSKIHYGFLTVEREDSEDLTSENRNLLSLFVGMKELFFIKAADNEDYSTFNPDKQIQLFWLDGEVLEKLDDGIKLLNEELSYENVKRGPLYMEYLNDSTYFSSLNAQVKKLETLVSSILDYQNISSQLRHVILCEAQNALDWLIGLGYLQNSSRELLPSVLPFNEPWLETAVLLTEAIKNDLDGRYISASKNKVGVASSSNTLSILTMFSE